MLKPLVVKVTRAVSRRVRKSNLPILSDQYHDERNVILLILYQKDYKKAKKKFQQLLNHNGQNSHGIKKFRQHQAQTQF